MELVEQKRKLTLNPSLKIVNDYPESVCFHPILWKIKKLSANARKTFFKLCELIDGNSGMLSQKMSDGKLIPLSRSQIEVFTNDMSAGRILDELVAYGFLAEFKLCKTKFYIANPFLVSKGYVANEYLMNIFNRVTLERVDEYNFFFDYKDTDEVKEVWKKR